MHFVAQGAEQIPSGVYRRPLLALPGGALQSGSSCRGRASELWAQPALCLCLLGLF